MQEPAASRRLLAVKIAVDVTTRLPLCGRMRRISRCHQQRGSPQITADAQAKQAEAQCINTEVRVAQAEALHKPRRCSSQLIASGTSRGAAHSSSSSVAQAETQLITSADTLAESQRITAVAQAAEQAASRRGPGERGLNAHEIGRTSVIIFFFSELGARVDRST